MNVLRFTSHCVEQIEKIGCFLELLPDAATMFRRPGFAIMFAMGTKDP
jgi:hypothetical protein